MNRRCLLQLAGAALVSGAPALRAYSFLTNNPLAAHADLSDLPPWNVFHFQPLSEEAKRRIHAYLTARWA